MKILGVIPSRFNSSRLPGKPLSVIGDKTMIMHVYHQCEQVKGFDELLVATDDQKIFNHVESNGGKVMMTSRHHSSGTDRCIEVLNKIEGEFDYVINIQGDEPFISPLQIDELIKILDGKVEIGTLYKDIESEEDLDDPSVPKIAIGNNNRAVYFSRSIIPFLRNETREDWFSKGKFFKHIGIYGYRSDILATLGDLKPSILEEMEQLEQLRWLAHGIDIQLAETKFDTISIDTAEDLERARALFHKK